MSFLKKLFGGKAASELWSLGAAADCVKATCDLADGKYDAAKKLLLEQEDAEGRFYLMEALATRDGGPGVDAWTTEEPKSHLAWCMKASVSCTIAEDMGNVSAEDVSEESLVDMKSAGHRAISALTKAAGLSTSDPIPPTIMVNNSLHLLLLREEIDEAFNDALSRQPGFTPAYLANLRSHSKVRAGKHDDMFEFARQTVRKAAKGSPLYVLLPYAHNLRWRWALKKESATNAKRYWSQGVRDEIVAVYKRGAGRADWKAGLAEVYFRNHFAYALYQCGETELARTELRKIAQKPTEKPWSSDGPALEVFNRVCKEVGV